jgi:D-alanyl-lipoteichoic acid acyltransferase DltB (MBOAT superfamily)
MEELTARARIESHWNGLATRHPRAAGVLQTLAVVAQLTALVFVVKQFQIETESFFRLCVLVLAGFAIHSHLPRAWRLPFFCALSVAALVLVLGPMHAVWVLGAGGVLIGLCHLPVAFGARVAALAGAGLLLALWRGKWLGGPVPEAVWPILGSMFMFRLIHYVYDLRHRKEPPSAAWTFAYFFMLPNVCFPLFPVVDYARFRTNYYSENDHQIYQRGMVWMARGIVHLLLYRAVYYHVTLDPAEVTTTAQLVQYALGAFFLYLRVSGYFHLIVGMLLLFGFNLPETHHLYFMASSFSDFWRRINIYWKDFMMKLFYYPAYFRLRRLGATTGLVLSTALVFAGTWALHSYQWFWLRGSFLIEAHDTLFWAILGVAMIANSVYEARHGRRRTLSGRGPNGFARAALALRTLATFMVLCALWSMWSSDTLEQWLQLWRTSDSLWLAAALCVGVPALAAASWALDRLAERRPAPKPAPRPPRPFFWFQAAQVGVATVVLLAIGRPEVFSRMGTQVAGVVEPLLEPRLNARDAQLLERGYYEHLIAVNQQNAELWQLYSGKPADWVTIAETVAWRNQPNMQLGELVPNTQITWLGQPLRINRWGFRDDDYELAKPPGTVRIAFMGSSHVFGMGVSDADVFEQALEQRLNAEGGGRYEILNFAVPNQNVIRDLDLLREKVLRFSPDVVVHFALTSDPNRMRRYVAELLDVMRVDEIPYPWLRELLQGLEIDQGTPRSIVERRVAPHIDEMLEWGYREFAAQARQAGVVPVFALLPLTVEASGQADSGPGSAAKWIERARRAGFEDVSIVDAYEGHDADDLQVAAWDTHPSALAHRLLAESMHRALVARPDLLAHRAAPAGAAAATHSARIESADGAPPAGAAAGTPR